MEIKFWGVRGSIPTPLNSQDIKLKIRKSLLLARDVDTSTEEKLDYFLNQLPFSVYGTFGGNTPCVSVQDDHDNIIILDMGSGARGLGYDLKQRYPNGKALYIFLSHTHWDHIQGIPFFLPIYDKNFTLIFHSPKLDIEERLIAQQEEKFFPAQFHHTFSKKMIKHIKENDELEINKDLFISSYKLMHPGDSFAYKITSNNKSVIYATDAEFYQLNEEFMNKMHQFWFNAEAIIFDAQYTMQEYISKINWGHSTNTMAVDIAVHCKIKKLILFHHEPIYTDEFIETTVRKSKEYLNILYPDYPLEILGAYEGLAINI
ncbi:MAG: MBL fold metallo-hydrolase [bacterium]|nr:MBL fold metallo-hydrolase [bacterium]